MKTPQDTRLATAFEQSGTGLPLVLMHGLANDCAVWQAQLTSLGRRWRVIAPDLRGFGRSAPADGTPISMDRWAVDEFMARLR